MWPLASYALVNTTDSSVSDFFVQENFDKQNRTSVKAREVMRSDRARLFLEESFRASLDSSELAVLTEHLKQSLETFDVKTYNSLRILFGSEWLPGLDNDARIWILLTPMEAGFGGYINTNDFRGPGESVNSNNHELVYINAAMGNDPRLDSMIAHEFQHLITFNVKQRLLGQNEPVWLNELRSEYAPTYLGFTNNFKNSQLEQRVLAFKSGSVGNFMVWDNNPADYAAVAMLGEYLGERFGPAIYGNMMRLKSVGLTSLDLAIQSLDSGQSFKSIYGDWLGTIIGNDQRLGAPFFYQRPELRVVALPALTILTPENSGSFKTISVDLTSYEPYLFDVEAAGGQGAQVEIRSPDGDLLVAYLESSNSSTPVIKKAELQAGESLFFGVPAGGRLSRIALSLTGPLNGGSVSATVRPLTPVDFGAVKATWPAVNSGGEAVINLESSQDLRLAQVSIAGSPKSIAVKLKSGNLYQARGYLDQGAGNYDIFISEVGGPKFKLGTLDVLPGLKAGNLYMALGESFAFITNQKYWRPIMDAKIVGLYNHLAAQKPIFVLPLERLGLEKSALVRAMGDEKVFLIDKQGQRHWLNIAASDFEATGRDWASIFEINLAELSVYPLGEPLIK